MKTGINSTIQDNKPLLAKIAGKFTADPYEREELVQETLIRSLSSLPKFIGHPKLISWWYVIMKHVYINRYRKVNLTRKAAKELTQTDLLHHTAINTAYGKFIIEDVKSAVSTLLDENYTIFSMYMEGYSYREIGDHLFIKEGTIKSRIHQIRKLLKKKLQVYR